MLLGWALLAGLGPVVALASPRCGRREDGPQLHHGRGARLRRFATRGERWDKTRLSWRLRDPYDLFKKPKDFAVVRRTVAHALKMWAVGSKGVLEFREAKGDVGNETRRRSRRHWRRRRARGREERADLDIWFGRWDHGDREPFDGRGGVVAHSGYPSEGRVHFDGSEVWTLGGGKGRKGVDLRYVVLHEFGHALGLRHSSEADAVMHPVYQSPHKRLKLSLDDVRGIQFLYPNKEL